MTLRPRLPLSSFRPPVALNGARRRARDGVVLRAARRGAIAARCSAERIAGQRRNVRELADAAGAHREHVGMHEAGIDQFADHEAGAARGLELVHVGAAVGVHARQQRHHVGQLGEVVPVDHDAGGARHGHPVDQVVGGAAGGQQGDHRVDDAALVDHLADGRALERCLARLAQHRAHGLARERFAHRVAGLDEGRARHVQAHGFQQHLVAVGGAVEGAGARRVIGRHLGVEQALAARPGPAPPVRAPSTWRCSTGPRASGRPARTRWASGRSAARRSGGPARSCRTRRAAVRHRTCRA